MNVINLFAVWLTILSARVVLDVHSKHALIFFQKVEYNYEHICLADIYKLFEIVYVRFCTRTLFLWFESILRVYIIKNMLNI